jgi:hypothetical protein
VGLTRDWVSPSGRGRAVELDPEAGHRRSGAGHDAIDAGERDQGDRDLAAGGHARGVAAGGAAQALGHQVVAAVAQAGDLFGPAQSVKLGTQGVRLTIDQVR